MRWRWRGPAAVPCPGGHPLPPAPGQTRGDPQLRRGEPPPAPLGRPAGPPSRLSRPRSGPPTAPQGGWARRVRGRVPSARPEPSRGDTAGGRAGGAGSFPALRSAPAAFLFRRETEPLPPPRTGRRRGGSPSCGDGCGAAGLGPLKTQAEGARSQESVVLAR